MKTLRIKISLLIFFGLFSVCPLAFGQYRDHVSTSSVVETSLMNLKQGALDLKDQNEALEEEIGHLEKNVDQLNRRLTQFQREQDVFGLDVRNIKSEVRNQDNETILADKKLDRVKMELDQFNQENKELRNLLAQKEDVYRSLQGEISDNETAIKDLKKKNGFLDTHKISNTVDVKRRHWYSLKENSLIGLRKAKKQLTHLEAKYKSPIKVFNELEEEKKSLIEEKGYLQNEYNKLLEEEEALTKELDKISSSQKENYLTITKDVSDLEKREKELKAVLTEVQVKIKDDNFNRLHSENDIVQLQENLNLILKENDNLKREINTLKLTPPVPAP